MNSLIGVKQQLLITQDELDEFGRVWTSLSFIDLWIINRRERERDTSDSSDVPTHQHQDSHLLTSDNEGKFENDLNLESVSGCLTAVSHLVTRTRVFLKSRPHQPCLKKISLSVKRCAALVQAEGDDM